MGGPYDRKEKSAEKRAEAPKPSSQPALADEYAATGMGNRTGHDVTRVNLELERRPMAQLKVRYEFHPQLVKLGVFPSSPTPLERREGASGFGTWCPEPGR